MLRLLPSTAVGEHGVPPTQEHGPAALRLALITVNVTAAFEHRALVRDAAGLPPRGLVPRFDAGRANYAQFAGAYAAIRLLIHVALTALAAVTVLAAAGAPV